MLKLSDILFVFYALQKKKKKKNILGTILINTFGELVSNCLFVMALASESKITSGNTGKYFWESGIVFREQGSTDFPWGPPSGYQAFRLQQFDDT